MPHNLWICTAECTVQDTAVTLHAACCDLCSMCWVMYNHLQGATLFEKYSWSALKALSEMVTAGKHCTPIVQIHPQICMSVMYDADMLHILLLLYWCKSHLV